jgi:hypothetical protein
MVLKRKEIVRHLLILQRNRDKPYFYVRTSYLEHILNGQTCGAFSTVFKGGHFIEENAVRLVDSLTDYMIDKLHNFVTSLHKLDDIDKLVNALYQTRGNENARRKFVVLLREHYKDVQCDLNSSTSHMLQEIKRLPYEKQVVLHDEIENLL